MGQLTTHVLDTTSGKPAAGMRIDFTAVGAAGASGAMQTLRTNGDGRTAAPLLAAGTMRVGAYTLAFHVADYYRSRGVALADPPFLDVVTVQFGIADTTAHYHVPLLCSPWSYSTYRGS
jgi:5-hydroxyisourate hydrolase